MKCSNCGSEFEGKFCPSCGSRAETQQPVTPPSVAQPLDVGNQDVQPVTLTKGKKAKKAKKPIYKKWWFYLIIAVVLIIIVGSFAGKRGEKIEWDKIKLGSILPEPSSNQGEIFENTNEGLWIDIYKTSEDDYNAYESACKEKGFTIDADTSSGYDSYNSDGYHLNLSWYDDEMTVKLDAPMQFSAIQWPDSRVGKLLPVPKSLTGKFSYEYDDNFFVYIGNTSKEDYIEYVNACAEKGFSVDYNKGDKYYYADNEQGYHISIKYEGNNIMSIDIDSPDEETAKNSNTTTSTTAATTTSAPSSTTAQSSKNANGIRTEFKEAMDSYEKFMDEYVAFMKKYENSDGTDMSLLADYANYMSKYADMVDKFDKWEDEDLNNAEMAYYLDVQTRVNKKLLEVSQ